MTYFMRSGLPVQFCDFENVNILFGKSRINPVFRSEPSFFPVSVGGSGRCDVCDDTTVKMMKSHAAGTNNKKIAQKLGECSLK